MGIEAAIIGAAIAGAGASAYSAKKQSDAQKKASARPRRSPRSRRTRPSASSTARTRRRPILPASWPATKRAEGAGSTMLTGPQGVSQDAVARQVHVARAMK